MMALPERSLPAEDAWLAALCDTPARCLVEHAHACLDAGRPSLAARVVGLLPPDHAAANPGLERARAAARLLLVAPLDRRGPFQAELEAAVRSCQTAHLDRARKRQRRNARDVMDPTRPRRRPRSTRGR
ncbi:MAG: hypothetical protein VX265_11185 [Myxococcota bacterium]|nr:hypothetical protein [Myxococcota bacterium]MEC8423374.1 hypothetical protein [Myxococcota bacterium]